MQVLENRAKTKVISIGGVNIGGNEPIRVQSMTNTETRDVPGTLEQIKALVREGCEIVRVAVKDKDSIPALKRIVDSVEVPIVADIHFNYRLAIMAVEAGAKGLRLNPGNIGSEQNVFEVVRCARDNQIPIRVGVNAGSLEKELEYKYGGASPEALVESALRHVRLIEKFGHNEIKISVKASDVITVIESYCLLSRKVEYPLHLGVTEAGSMLAGSVKSAVAIGVLLSRGIGDTVRVSLTGDPIEEVRTAYLILSSLGLRELRRIEIVSCPTCGRCQWDVEKTVFEIESKTRDVMYPLKVAIMGCPVNGPGEAKHADIGVAGGKRECLLFKKGQVVGKMPHNKVVEVLLREIKGMTGGSKGE